MAKSRRTIVTELIEAFGAHADCEYSAEQLWGFFDACVESKTLKKLSKARESTASNGSSNGLGY